MPALPSSPFKGGTHKGASSSGVHRGGLSGGGWGGEPGEAMAYKWHALLQAAAAALVPILALARSESPAVVQVGGVRKGI